jgi:hypothetical protein
MVPKLLDALDFRSNNAIHRPVIDGLALVRRYATSRQRYIPFDEVVPIDGVVRPLLNAFGTSLAANCSLLGLVNAALRTPATPSWLIRWPLRLRRRGRRLSGLPLSAQRDHFADRLLLGLMRDELAVVAAPEPERDR